MVEHVQTKREIRSLLSAAGLRPRRRLGQHFLVDGNLMRRLLAAAEIAPDDTVLEVGGGTGGLTDLLVDVAGRVICVEMDPRLYELLMRRFSRTQNLTLIQGDVLERKHRLRAEVAELIQDAAGQGEVKLVANLPYQAATPLVMNLLESFPAVTRLCFTVQAEVGERMGAGPGRGAYGPLSILSQSFCDIQTLAKLSPQVFWPPPAVGSVMMRMDVVRRPFRDIETVMRFASMVRRTFEHRRKVLRAALGYFIPESAVARAGQSFDLTRRPEALSVSEWQRLFKLIDEDENMR